LPRQLSVAFSSAAHLSWQGPEDNEKLRQTVIQAVQRLEPEAANGGAA
jgi:hypothetical protein